ncbi:MAG: hypothetical protein U5S82_14470 [Gammaproteobacteria bacterium]|nr:hypothetical protein [Gammaproteobacteria bacterium]
MLWAHCPLCDAPLFEPMRPPPGEDTVFSCPECGGLLRREYDDESGEERLVGVDPRDRRSSGGPPPA